MIHYTLLPDREMRSLKREYKIRLFIALAFFVSCGVMLGIASLAPAYLLSFSKEKEASDSIKVLQKEGEAKGINSVISELASTTKIMKKLDGDEIGLSYSQMISEIIVHKNSQITLNSFKMTKSTNASSTAEVVIQGKALSRDALINLKKDLENDVRISKLELPVSDLAKSKDITFAIKFNIKQ